MAVNSSTAISSLSSSSSMEFVGAPISSSAPKFCSVPRTHSIINGSTQISTKTPLKLSVFAISPTKQLKIYSRKTSRVQLQHLRLSRIRALGNNDYIPDEPPTSDSNGNKKLIVMACSTVTVALAIANRVLYKLALVPLKEYPFFLAQLTTFGYVAVYFSVLYMRYRSGIATDEMLALPKSPFIIIGFLEALGVVSGMYSGAVLPGPAIPILSQTFLVWQLVFSILLLGRSYSLNRISGCFLVAAGVVLAVASGSDSDQMLSGVGIFWPAMMIASSAFQALASIVKESVFLDATHRLKGKLLDIFVVNSFGSGFQALFVLLFLPFLSNLKGIPLTELPSYLKTGATCFFNVGSNTTGCDGAPMLPLLYIIINITFNISLLNLLKYSSAIVSSLAVMSSVPISIYILSLPLPYLPEGASLSPYFVLGSVILMVGLVLYNISWPLQQD
ncbi:CRT (chloroquine-resistance transporter)-like transporter 2 [Forsythia ovata]|uniref:CRT (Chloroquine-resistance transporter)-like transporter 2 n=1 Tax=Forsythia ovata TaxID=205694 RepID=A0ABD1UX65_9LAMI